MGRFWMRLVGCDTEGLEIAQIETDRGRSFRIQVRRAV